MSVGTRALVAASLAAAALAVAGPALGDRGRLSSGSTTTVTNSNPTAVSVQGVVQSLSGSAVVVRQLDGSTVSIAIDRRTKVTVDGRTGKIGDIRPGFVVLTTVKPGQPAAALRFLRPS